MLCLQSNTNGSFLQNCINFVEQQLKFAHLKGSIVPYPCKNRAEVNKLANTSVEQMDQFIDHLTESQSPCMRKIVFHS